MMNTNRTLPQVLILGTVLIASALVCSVHAADATLSFTGEIIPAYNGAKATANNEKSMLSTNRESTKEININKGEDHATR
ncbi:hypothetical protein [Pseudescherichia vulneris]|uniref:hypothetical protein n=1 Tax=Pseudescherichia vulneris TaxID=566 RepID=UPI0028D3D75D|nr:hypothetical protein [Pseudescherichia vulneris]